MKDNKTINAELSTAASEPTTILIHGYRFVAESKMFENSDAIWTYVQSIRGSKWDVLAFEEIQGKLAITTDITNVDGWVCNPVKDGRFINMPDIREDIAVYICKNQGIEPEPTRGRGGLDTPGGFGHISHGSRKCPEGYNYGYCY